MPPKIFVTTAHKLDTESEQLALACSQKLGVPFIPRLRRSLEEISKELGDAGFLIISKKGQMTLVYKEEEFFFHPSMSKVRIKGLRKGQNDPMLTAMKAGEGNSILDCTLGLGSDAIVSSYAVGDKGKVVGVEASPVLSLITQYGLQHYQDTNKLINEVMRRVVVVNDNYMDYLQMLPDNCFDIVYFDPMFRKPLKKSSSMEPMRTWVNPDSLEAKAISEAVRVAKQRVIMKEASDSEEFARLGFTEVESGKYSPVAYGIIRITG